MKLPKVLLLLGEIAGLTRGFLRNKDDGDLLLEVVTTGGVLSGFRALAR